jgi:hypothetical protein
VNTSENAIGVGLAPYRLEHLHPPCALRRAQLETCKVFRLVDRAGVVGDVAEAVLEVGQDAVALGLGSSLERVAHGLLDALHVVAVLDDVGHFEHAERVSHRRHHRRGQREGDLAELQLLHQLLVLAQLRRAEHLHFCLVAQCCVGALGELVNGSREQRAGVADMAEFQNQFLGMCADAMAVRAAEKARALISFFMVYSSQNMKQIETPYSAATALLSSAACALR